MSKLSLLFRHRAPTTTATCMRHTKNCLQRIHSVPVVLVQYGTGTGTVPVLHVDEVCEDGIRNFTIQIATTTTPRSLLPRFPPRVSAGCAVWSVAGGLWPMAPVPARPLQWSPQPREIERKKRPNLSSHHSRYVDSTGSTVPVQYKYRYKVSVDCYCITRPSFHFNETTSYQQCSEHV